MSNPFDPYREALVIETTTVWPGELASIEPAVRRRVEQRLHADPRQASHMAYIRLHTGFCREITVDQEDLRRLGEKDAP